MFEQIRFEVRDQVATVTLDRPERLNAFTLTMKNELIAAIDAVDGDDDIRAVVITGEGRAFCAGMDMEEGPESFVTPGAESPIRADGSIDYAHPGARDGGGMLALRLYRCLKPVIVAVNGPAAGIGATFPLAADIRLASEQARFGFVFSRRGIVPEAASSWFLPRIVGISQALEWCYSGRLVPAAEAKERGLVRQVLPPDELLPAALAMAAEITANAAPVSVALIRQMMWRGLGMSHPMEAHRVDSRGVIARARSGDVAEGVASFFEKRPPRFPDRVSTDMPDYFPWWEEPDYY